MTLMAYREVTIRLGFWEDVPGFEKTDAELARRASQLFPGVHTASCTTAFEAWQVNDFDELEGQVL